MGPLLRSIGIFSFVFLFRLHMVKLTSGNNGKLGHGSHRTVKRGTMGPCRARTAQASASQPNSSARVHIMSPHRGRAEAWGPLDRYRVRAKESFEVSNLCSLSSFIFN